MHNSYTNCSSKTGFRRQRGKTTILKHFFQRNVKEKISSAKIEKNLLPKHQSQPSCIHYTTIHESQLQKDNSITHAAAAARNLDAAIPLRSAQTELQNTIAQRQQRRGKVTLNPKLAQSISQYYFVLQSLQEARPSTTLYYRACTKHVPVLHCTTKLAQSISQYYFVLQSLQEARPSTTLYYRACTKHVPVLLCTTKLAQSTSQYYFVLQSLHKVLPSTTLYYKARKRDFPVLPCTTKLAQNMSQYYCVLQSLQTSQKECPCTTLYYKACTKARPSTTLYSHYIAFCSITWLTRISLRTWQQNATTIMQPSHCNLKPEIQQAHRNTHT